MRKQTQRWTPFFLGLLLVSFSIQSEAAVRRRPSIVRGNVLSGTVLEVNTNIPVYGASVKLQGRIAKTNRDGFFLFGRLNKGESVIEISRWGYHPVTQNVTIIEGTAQLTTRLNPKPIARLIDVNGKAYELDDENANFYIRLPMAVGEKLSPLKVCLRDGSSRLIEKDSIKRVTGPSVKGSYPACCASGTTTSIQMTLDSGEQVNAFLKNCEYYDVVFKSRNRVTSDDEWFSLDQVRSIEFP